MKGRFSLCYVEFRWQHSRVVALLHFVVYFFTAGAHVVPCKLTL